MTTTTTTTDDLSEVAATDESEPVAPDEPSPRATLTLGEAAALGAVLLVGSIGTVSLVLAQAGRHDGVVAVVLGVVLTLALGAGALAFGRRPAIEIDWVEVGLLTATLLAAAFFFLPGFPYAYADKDPGLYVAHGFAIADHGDVNITSEPRQLSVSEPETWGGNFPGVWPVAGTTELVTSQFFHYTSSLMATSADLAGRRGLFNMTPLLAVLSVGVLVVAARRVAGTVAAGIFGVLLVTSMMQVWQAKYPSTEIPAQLFLSGALLAGVLAIERRWAGGAFAAGLLVALSFLVRPDGFLYVVLAVGIAAGVIALGLANVRHLLALGAGVALVLPFALWNAYEERYDYSKSNSLPSLQQLALAGAGLLVLGAAARVVLRRIDTLETLRRWQRPLGIGLAVLTGVTLLVLWNRNTLFGQSYIFNAASGEMEPNLNEFNLRWLSLYVSLPGLAIMCIGVAVATLRRPRPALYLLMFPGLVLLPLYLWDAKVSMRMMWWVRRFIPAVLPTILLLIALALAWALLHRSRVLRGLGLAGVIGLAGFFTVLSWPLRDHREMGGTWDMAAAVAAPAGDEAGVFLFTESTDLFDPMRNIPTSVWWIFDQTSAKLPPQYDMRTIDEYQSAFPDRPVFLVLHGELPPELPAERFELAGLMENELVVWDEWPWGAVAEGEPAKRPSVQLRSVKRLAIWRVADRVESSQS